MDIEKIKTQIFAIQSLSDFNELALQIFQFQYKNNEVYHNFIDLLKININKIIDYNDIPCLPIEFFKTHSIASVPFQPELIFQSSGTTDTVKSKSLVFSKSLYEDSIYNTFYSFYGNPKNYIITALTPDNLSSPNSSLAYMLNFLIKKTENNASGFYLNKEQELLKIIKNNPNSKIILIGVTYALINFAEHYPLAADNLLVIETGGMKGQFKEMTRNEVHSFLLQKLSSQVNSEYSMAELMSQAYSIHHGIFKAPSWMQIRIRDIYDPLYMLGQKKSGGIDIIDLANIYTCSFISTKDIGIMHDNFTFEVLGRYDFSDIRGCNLMQNAF